MFTCLRQSALATLAVFIFLPQAVFAAMPVSTVKLINEQFKTVNQYTGRAEAINSVELVSRTNGFLEKILFTDGQYVSAGSELFRLDSAEHHASLQLAQSQVDAAQATLNNQQQLLDRYTTLAARNSISQNELDNAQAQRDIALANLRQAKANLSLQQLNYDYTTITAPISGRIGRSNVHQGAFISNATGALAEIVQLDPIYVAFSINEREFLQKNSQFISLAQLKEAYTPFITVNNQRVDGELVFVNNRVDSNSASILVRAEFPNQHEILLPGNNITVTVASNSPADTIFISARALQQDVNGHFVFLVDQNNQVEKRYIEIGRQVNQRYQVVNGLNAGELVIVSGLQRIRAGMTVLPQIISE